MHVAGGTFLEYRVALGFSIGRPACGTYEHWLMSIKLISTAVLSNI
jgi:hypothetical protein